MAVILISSPSDDTPKRYAQYFLRRYADSASKQGHRVLFLSKPLLYNFENAVKKYNPDLVIVNGHGGSKGVTGLDAHVILGTKTYDKELRTKIIDENPELMKGRIVYLISCFSGKELAQSLIDHGATAVAGYRSALVFLTNEGRPIHADPLVKRYFTAILQLPIMLAKGQSFGVGSQAVIRAFEKYRDEAELSGENLEAKYHHFNMENFISLGSRDATIWNVSSTRP